MATIDEVKEVVINLARDQVGYHEGFENYNKYAEMPELQTIYGWNVQNQPWCAVFVNWLFLTAYGTDLGKRMTYGCSASCAVQASYYQTNGATSNRPETGDQFFQYAGGGINHTGIVVEVNGDKFVTIEGNYSDGVYYVNHNVFDSDVATFGRPNWSLVATDSSESGCTDDACPIDFAEDAGEPIEMPTVQYGDMKSRPVKVAQAVLIAFGYGVGRDGADGDFGSNTLLAVKKFQKDNGLDPDGIIGSKSWTKLLKG